ncbi:cbb3-type cytochrome c oxidase subunit II [Lysobacter niastensis]|uniref:Cbb3-type cytochrome c oxidase subunit II n=1 Tax=Lysobacter niastensis TaxID=380629 RepID=A0ABS0BEB1_9GAMM|nr:cbb3-type cytochrome c oxidase subunit II [Lysobacter niastensis]MBF6025440.1 cbb3-type cytochrome c oxidase subunit II [Lysobacter niastensis]
MENEVKLVGGAMLTLALATAAMIAAPFLQLKDVPPPKGLKPYTDQELRGRQIYISNGCMACHTQQPSATGAGRADASRGWGRPSVAADYFYDRPTLLGTMRTGPDLFNVGDRIPSQDWHYGHLYQPRAYVPASVMPAYPFLFESIVDAEVRPGQYTVPLPKTATPPGRKIVPTRDAEDLVAYLKAMRRKYEVVEAGNAAQAKEQAMAIREGEGSGVN